MSAGVEKLAQIVSRLPRSPNIVTSMAAGEPFGFWSNLHKLVRMPQMQGATIYCANPSQVWEVLEEESAQFCVERNIRIAPVFLSHELRNHADMPHMHYCPGHLSQWENNIEVRCVARRLEDQGLSINVPRTIVPIPSAVDLFVGSCSLPDARGFVSLGVSNAYESSFIRRANISVLEISESMPRLWGPSSVSTTRPGSPTLIDDGPKRELPTYNIGTGGPDPKDIQIATHCANMIADGSTIQFGIGGIPNALADLLLEKKDLGVHTEMINNAIYNLVNAGVVTGKNKTIFHDKVIGTFAFGTKQVYEWLDQNPVVELHPGKMVNDPTVIGQNHRMTSINSAVEVSVTGQVCSESVGHKELSGVGGAADTHVGAQRSVGGRGCVALHSTTRPKKLSDEQLRPISEHFRDDFEEISQRVGTSKIAFQLTPGAKISVSRNDVDTVVTECGATAIKGCTVERRANSLIGIAHKEWREFINRACITNGYLPKTKYFASF